jgi:hypothetical protein
MTPPDVPTDAGSAGTPRPTTDAPGGGPRPAARPPLQWPAAVLVIMLVIAASALVAIGATGFGLFQPPAELDGRWLRAIRIAGAVAAVAGFAALIVLRRGIRWDPKREPDPTAGALATAGVIMGVLALLALMAPRLSPPAEPVSVAETSRTASPNDSMGGDEVLPIPPSEPRGGGFPSRGSGDGGRSGVPGEGSAAGLDGWPGGAGWGLFQRIAAAPLLLLLLAAVGASVWLLRGSRPGPTGRPLEPEDAEAGLAASWDEVAYEGTDPRGQISAAYGRLLRALADAGASREPHEAPHEHLDRVLGPLGVRPAPMRRLTELYVLAQFSEHPITDRHRAAAAESLESALADLRTGRATDREAEVA